MCTPTTTFDASKWFHAWTCACMLNTAQSRKKSRKQSMLLRVLKLRSCEIKYFVRYTHRLHDEVALLLDTCSKRAFFNRSVLVSGIYFIWTFILRWFRCVKKLNKTKIQQHSTEERKKNWKKKKEIKIKWNKPPYAIYIPMKRKLIYRVYYTFWVYLDSLWILCSELLAKVNIFF